MPRSGFGRTVEAVEPFPLAGEKKNFHVSFLLVRTRCSCDIIFKNQLAFHPWRGHDRTIHFSFPFSLNDGSFSFSMQIDTHNYYSEFLVAYEQGKASTNQWLSRLLLHSLFTQKLYFD